MGAKAVLYFMVVFPLFFFLKYGDFTDKIIRHVLACDVAHANQDS